MQGWNSRLTHNTRQLLISNMLCMFNPKMPLTWRLVSLRGLFSLRIILHPSRCITVFFNVATYCSGSNKAVFSCRFQQMSSQNGGKKKPFFFPVFRWWTSQAVVFVFAEWWKADGMLLSSTWVDDVYAEGHNSPRLLNNVDYSQVHCVKSSHPTLTFNVHDYSLNNALRKYFIQSFPSAILCQIRVSI